VISRPDKAMRPAVGASKPASIIRVVVLPDPEGPSSVRNSPRGDIEIEILHHRATRRRSFWRSAGKKDAREGFETWVTPRDPKSGSECGKGGNDVLALRVIAPIARPESFG